MIKTKPASRMVQPPLETGQVWCMPEANLRVGLVGRLLVHYKLGKPNAVRTPSSCNSIKTIQAYLKAKKAVLAPKPVLAPKAVLASA